MAPSPISGSAPHTNHKCVQETEQLLDLQIWPALGNHFVLLFSLIVSVACRCRSESSSVYFRRRALSRFRIVPRALFTCLPPSAPTLQHSIASITYFDMYGHIICTSVLYEKTEYFGTKITAAQLLSCTPQRYFEYFPSLVRVPA